MPNKGNEDGICLEDFDGYLASSMEADLFDGNKVGCEIRTRDLISWSFQIARGMDHLANKKVTININKHS